MPTLYNGFSQTYPMLRGVHTLCCLVEVRRVSECVSKVPEDANHIKHEDGNDEHVVEWALNRDINK